MNLKVFRLFKLSLFVLVALVCICYLKLFTYVEKYIIHIEQIGPEYLIKTPGCRIPKHDPFHPSVAVYYENITDTQGLCEANRSYLIVVGNRIHLDHQKVSDHFGVHPEKVACSYQPIVRLAEEDDDGKSMDFETRMLPPKILKFGAPMTDEFLKISCSTKENGTIFEDYIALVFLKPEVEIKREPVAKERLSETPLSVIVLAIDSVSKLNFLRQFPNTHEFLQNVLKPFEFHGHTKVADNTFVNIVPMFTGRFVSEYRNRSNIDNTYYDDLDLVWKDYASVGYRTYYAEDYPFAGTFTFNKIGFKKPPTDYYLRPLVQAVDSLKWRYQYGSFCLGHTTEYDFQYNYLKDFLATIGKRPFFAFAFVSEITHDYLNYAKYLDIPTFELLQNMYSSGVFNRSAFVFFSDHGIRYGDILNTYIGKMEERMPFMFQYYPEWFLKKHPDVAESLRINQHRLTTPFDVHKTLQDILSLSVKGSHNKSTGHGQSLFKEIPTTRTCADASIHPHWCTCHDRKEIPKDDPRAVEAARVMIQTINEWTNSTSETNDSLCSKLSVTDIVDAYITPPSEEEIRRAKEDPQKLEFQDPEYFRRKEKEVLEEEQGPLRASDIKWSSETFLVSARAEPGYGVFEGTLMNIGGEFVVLGDISRINRYGDQSWCVQDPVLKKYCYCKVAKENDDDNRIRRRRKKREVVMNKIPEVTPFKKD